MKFYLFKSQHGLPCLTLRISAFEDFEGLNVHGNICDNVSSQLNKTYDNSRDDLTFLSRIH